ncbi:MAG: hypothetical protein ACQETB_06985 [Halobacteriota archaeon]
MANQCRYLQYRTDGQEMEFDTPRAYCTAVDSFVQPMRADICNYRYDLDPETDCEYYEAAQASANDDGGDR